MLSPADYRPVGYFALTFAVTYTLWFAGAWLSFHQAYQGLYMAVMLPGLMAPFLISLGFILRTGNRQMKRDFLRRLVDVRLFNLRMIPVFLLLMPAVTLVSISLSLLVGADVAQFRFAEDFSFSTGAVPVLAVLLLAAIFEELGWRGYAFDSLRARFSFLGAAVVFSVLWSAWHLPLLFVKDSYQYEILNQNIWFAVNFFVSILPMGVIISWVCVKSRKSILAAALFHFIINMSAEALNMSQLSKCIETGVLGIVAVGLIYLDPSVFRRKPERHSATA